ncbi:MmgE/PrpD family protein [Cucumibacter marinus]|uniref:MmgE/PrpD family protein n=1 Tax=Cucumibacter marinus TaxID=1121252 RepID=UPI00041AFFD6|nr:MmgE/PrpD family protein [Cucumibacter marinus]
MPAPLTRTLAGFVSGLRDDHIPVLATEAILTGLTDVVGVMFAGVNKPVSKYALAFIGTRGRVDGARLLLGDQRASANEAAFVNAATLTSVVFDDVAFGGCHTSGILMPAIFAEAEAIGASGADVIRAYAAGYEVWARLAERDPDSYASKGWHATANFGAFAAAAALSSLHRLDEDATLRALGLAASMTGGTTAAFDTDATPVQVGRASAAGIMAVRLAMSGATAPADALERPGRGMLVALSPNGRVDLDTPVTDLGIKWRLETIGIHCKQYPFGNMMQRALDGILDLVREHDVRPDQVARVEALLSEAQFEVVSKSPSVTSFVPGFSVGLAMSAAIINRRAGFEELQPAFYERSDVRQMMDKVEMKADAAIPADKTPNLGFSGAVRLHLKDSRVLESEPVTYARGHWTRRMSADERRAKFLACSADHLGEQAAHRLFDQLCDLGSVRAISDLNTVP